MHNKSNDVKIKRDANQSRFSRQIGSTTFLVNIHFNKANSETLHEKVLRLMKNELKLPPKCATIKSLQAGWLLERSSS